MGDAYLRGGPGAWGPGGQAPSLSAGGRWHGGPGAQALMACVASGKSLNHLRTLGARHPHGNLPAHTAPPPAKQAVMGHAEGHWVLRAGQTWVRRTQWNKDKCLELHSPRMETSILTQEEGSCRMENRGGGEDRKAATSSGEKGHVPSPCLASGETTTATKRGLIKATYLGRLGAKGGGGG